MCKCTPEIKTPFCGRGECKWPGVHSGQVPQSVLDELKEKIGSLDQEKIEAEEKAYKLIATVASAINAETIVTKLLPKGKVIIGTGESRIDQILNVSPKMNL